MTLNCRLLTASVLTVTLSVSAGLAQEKKIQRKDLPPAVEKTVTEQSKGATIKGFTKEVDDGKTLYEVELRVNGHGKDISIDTQGNVVEVEEEVALTSLPPAVRDGLANAAKPGTIDRVETLTKNGKLVAYEAAVKSGKRTSEVQVGPDGKKLSRPE